VAAADVSLVAVEAVAEIQLVQLMVPGEQVELVELAVVAQAVMVVHITQHLAE
jgi:hypothetical protein